MRTKKRDQDLHIIQRRTDKKQKKRKKRKERKRKERRKKKKKKKEKRTGSLDTYQKDRL